MPATSAGMTTERSLRRVDARLRLRVDEAAGLAPPQRRVVAAVPQELLVRALLDDMTVIEHDQPVHPRDGRQAVRDRDYGLAGHQRVEACLDRRLDLAVERRGRLVKH